MKIVTKILGVFSAIGAFFSAIFFVLLKQSKTEKKLQEVTLEAEKKKYENLEAVYEAGKQVSKNIANMEAEDEELNQRVHSGCNLDNFNASLSLLQKQSERGNKRNSSSDNSGA